MTETSIPQPTDSWEGSLALALALNARYGLPCIPDYGVTPKDPTKPLKRPILNGWQALEAGTPDAIKKLWSQAKGRTQSYLVGVVCNGLLVIDIDTAEGHASAADGRPQWEAWQNEYGSTPTLSVRTQSGGMHVYYRLPQGVVVTNGAGKLAPGIDQRTAGGQVVAPGNVFSVGGELRQYQVLEEGPADTGYIAEAPDWLLYKVTGDNVWVPFDMNYVEEAAKREIEKQGLTGEARDEAIKRRYDELWRQEVARSEENERKRDLGVDMTGARSYDGRRGHAPLSARTNGYIRNTLSKICAEIKSIGAGERNNGLNERALRIMRLWQWGCRSNGATISQDAITDALYEAGTAAGLEPGEVKATIQSASKSAATMLEPDAIKNLRMQAERDRYGDLDAEPLQRPARTQSVASDAISAPSAGIPVQAAVNAGAAATADASAMTYAATADASVTASASAPASVPTTTTADAAAINQGQQGTGPLIQGTSPSVPGSSSAAPMPDAAQPSVQAAQTAAPAPNPAAPQQTAAASTATGPAPAAPDYAKWYYGACGGNLANKDKMPQGAQWLARRGISIETARKAFVGYDPICDPIGAPGSDPEEVRDRSEELHLSKRLIVPTSPQHFLAVAIDPTTPEKYRELSPKRSKAGLFFPASLRQTDGCVFVTDNWLSALSYMQVGASAVATVTKKNTGLLLETIEAEKTGATLILAFSNTDAGRQARDIVKGELRRKKTPYLVANVDITGRGDTDPDNVEMPNDLLCNDADAFKAAVQRIQEPALARPDNTLDYIDNGEMARDIAKARDPIPTGYELLDQETGGLYPGLYVIGAISGLGKTTFCAQMCDQIAAAGHDVIFVSMEMSRLEIVSKSLARITYTETPGNAWTSKNIRHRQWNSAVVQAVRTYKERVDNRVSIIEGNFNVDMAYISDYIRNHIERNATRPVVFIDYLQILQPSHSETKQTAKQQVDLCITEIKQLSRDLSIPIVVVSSLNRGSYLTPTNFTAFKESGGIEYTADVIWGMQLACLNDPLFLKGNNEERGEYVNQEKDRPERHIQLRCLKNRYGRCYSAFFEYVPAYDYYEEITEEDALPKEHLEDYDSDDLDSQLSAATAPRRGSRKADADADADAIDPRTSIPGFEEWQAAERKRKAKLKAEGIDEETARCLSQLEGRNAKKTAY